MGNDGGTIARRSDLVQTKQTSKTSLDIDPRLQARNTWAQCALSRLPLKKPVVADALGNLYRKEKVVEFLLKKAEIAASASGSASGDGKDKKEIGVAGHLRGLKDVKLLNLTVSTQSSSSGDNNASDTTPFLCPLTSKVMNGSTGRFIYIRTCGCVMSESGLRSVAESSKKDQASSSASASASPESDSEQTTPCPVCSALFNSASLSKVNNEKERERVGEEETMPPMFQLQSDLIPIYPSAQELEWLKTKMNSEREAEKLKKKPKKSKHEGSSEIAGEEVSDSKEERKKKKAEKRSATEASLDPSNSVPKAQRVPQQAAPQTAAQRLALEAKQNTEEKKKKSEALRNLYGEDEFGKKKAGKQSESWMTRGTFTRYA